MIKLHLFILYRRDNFHRGPMKLRRFEVESQATGVPEPNQLPINLHRVLVLLMR